MLPRPWFIISSVVFLANYGFSLGINDVIPGPILTGQKEAKIEKAYADCLDLIAKAKKGQLENKPGCNQEETLEAQISKVLSDVREAVGKLCMKELSRQNAPLIMATCGSKGTICEYNETNIFNSSRRFGHQRISDGCLCRAADYRWSSCT